MGTCILWMSILSRLDSHTWWKKKIQRKHQLTTNFIFSFTIAATYNGTLCKDYVNYQVWVPPGVTTAMLEGGLASAGMNQSSLGQLKATLPTCYDYFMINTCSGTFPRIDPTPVQNQRKDRKNALIQNEKPVRSNCYLTHSHILSSKTKTQPTL